MKNIFSLTFIFLLFFFSFLENSFAQRLQVFSGVDPHKATEHFRGIKSFIEIEDGFLVTDAGNYVIKKIIKDKVYNYIGNGKKEDIDGLEIDASFNYPTYMIKDSDDNIFVVTDYNTIIRKINSDGDVTTFAGNFRYDKKEFEPNPDATTTKEKSNLYGISAIQLDNEGNFIFSNGSRIRKLDNKGMVSLISGGKEKGNKTGNLKEATYEQISDIIVSDSLIYVCDNINKNIKKINLNNRKVSILVEKGLMSLPSSMCITFENKLVVLDTEKKELFFFDLKGKHIKTSKLEELENESFGFYESTIKSKIKEDKFGNFIIPSVHYLNIYSPEGKLIKRIGKKRKEPENTERNAVIYNKPFDGDIDKKGNMYFIDRGDNKIIKIQKNDFVSVFYGSDKTDSISNYKTIQLKDPIALTMNKNDEVFVLDNDYKSSKIFKFDDKGRAFEYFNFKKLDSIKVERLNDMVFDSKGNLYISDAYASKVYKINENKKITEFLTKQENNLRQPMGLDIDKEDNLFVCDTYNDRVLKIRLKDKKIYEIKTKDRYELDHPENITINDVGQIFLTDKNRTRVLMLLRKTKKLYTSKMMVSEGVLGSYKNSKLSEYRNTLKVISHGKKLFFFDKYNSIIHSFNANFGF